MRPACAAIEIAGDAGALERVFEHADVLLRRPHENRHLVEPDAARGLLQHTARDFHTLPAFAGSGKPYELAAALARRRRVVGKQITCEVTEVSLPDVFNELDGHAAIAQPCDGSRIARRDRDQRRGRLVRERPQESRLGFRVERHVEEQHWHPRPAGIGGAERLRRGFKERGPIARAGVVHQQLDAIHQFGEIRSAPRGLM